MSRPLASAIDNRDWLADERHPIITLGRGESNNVVVKGHLISRLHAQIEVSHNRFID